MSATVNAAIADIRTTHRIDVLVCPDCDPCSTRRWLVECKFQQRKVTKRDIVAFIRIVAETGAERGFFVTESGFQSGAVAAATSTNIVLCSLEGLRTELRGARLQYRCREIESRAIDTRDQLDRLRDRAVWPYPEGDRGNLYVGLLNWRQWSHWHAAVGLVLDNVAYARRSDWPVAAGVADPVDRIYDGDVLLAGDADSFIEVATKQLDAANDWVDAAQQWVAAGVAVAGDDGEHDLLRRRLRAAFEAASWHPLPLTGATPGEAEAASLIREAVEVSYGYHVEFTPQGIPYIGWNSELFLVLDAQHVIWLAGDYCTRQGDCKDSPRLIIEPVARVPVSDIETRASDLGRVMSMEFIRDGNDREAGARLEFENKTTLYAWVEESPDRELTVAHSLEGLPAGFAGHRPREVLRRDARGV